MFVTLPIVLELDFFVSVLARISACADYKLGYFFKWPYNKIEIALNQNAKL